MLSAWHEHHTELRAHGITLRENAHHLIRRGAGGHVVIRRFTPQQQIADASTGKVGFMAMLAQGSNDRDGKMFEHGDMGCTSR